MSVVACPKCAEKVTLPPKAPPEAKVRCPLCGENYALAEAMTSLPPMLEVLELPEGFKPTNDIDISASAFLSSPDRPVPTDDDDSEFRLEGGTVATEEDLEPRYDQWGDTRSSASSTELGEPQVKRELSTSKPRRRKKAINPIYHVLGIVMGGVVAIPAALLILLWMPGSLRRDPVEIGPWLGKKAPFLVPAEFRTGSSDQPKEGSTGSDKTALAANKTPKKTEATKKAVESNNVTPNDKAVVAARPADPNPLETPLFSGDEPEPKEEPLLKEPSIEEPLSNPLEVEPPMLDKPEPKESDPQEPSDDPQPEVKPEPTDEPEPTVDPIPMEDPLQPQREALTQADQAFAAATTSAEKKETAKAMYRAAAELAEKLPGDTGESADLEIITKDAMKLLVVGRYATTWLDSEERTSNGIVLSGNVKSCSPAGERFEVVVELPSSDKREVLVIAPKELEAGEKVFVAGKIVENAKLLVSGYEGEATKAVDARLVQVVTP